MHNINLKGICIASKNVQNFRCNNKTKTNQKLAFNGISGEFEGKNGNKNLRGIGKTQKKSKCKMGKNIFFNN